MPLIQIEQDSPEVIERVRARMAEALNQIDPIYSAHVAVMHMQGYAAGLMESDVLSPETFMLLTGEMESAVTPLG